MTQPKALTLLDILTALLLAAAFAAVLFLAPLEASMGAVQKIFYFHVACAWTGMLGFLFSALGGALYLIGKNPRWDRFSYCGVEIGLVFLLISIVSGSIWAHAAWNTWWTWDPRLTTTAIMELAYLAYLMLRQGLEDPERRARFSAVYAILAFISVPLTFLSIRLFRTIHPVLFGNPSSAGTLGLAPGMRWVFFFTLFVFSILFVDLFWHRLRLAALAARVEQLKLTATER